MRFYRFVLLALVLIAAFYVAVPKVCPGFPVPDIVSINATQAVGCRPGEIVNIPVTVAVKNTGSDGYLVITAALTDSTNGRTLSSDSRTFFLKAGENTKTCIILPHTCDRACSVSVTGKPRGYKFI